MDIVEIDPVDTHDLRRHVLRHGTRSDAVVFDGDDQPTTFHLGIRTPDGHVVATSTWLARPYAAEPDRPAHQLRGMAIAPEQQGRGLGTRLLRAGLDMCAERGSEVLWAHARSTALGFYLRHGFTVCGDEYVDAATGLPHVDVAIALVRTPRPD